MCKNKRNTKGLSSQNKKEHQKDHMQWSRRDFMQTMGLTTSVGLMMGGNPLTAFTSAANNYTGETDRILVIIRLAGGNDGLNTIIPLYDFGTYQQYRPTVAHARSEITELSSEFGIPSSANNFMNLWQEGKMKVIHGVGYPDQNLSHFRSTDIWSTAESEEEITAGWLGKLISLDDPDITMDPPEHPSAIQIGNSGNLTFNNTENVNLSFQVSNTNQLFQIAEQGLFYPVDQLPDCLHGEQVEYVRSIANSTFRYADVIQQAYEGTTNTVDYTNSNLASQLAIVARLIKGGLRTSFYMVNLNGFDTHANQMNAHNNLMRVLSSNIKEFYEDLGSEENRVLSMTSSEFGRRPRQNSSNGTDHGAAAPLMMFGPALEGNGFIGTHPDLSDLDDANNLKFSTDFRQVYQTVMTNWLCFPQESVADILQENYNPLDLGFECNTTRNVRPYFQIGQIEMQTHASGNFTFIINIPEDLQAQAHVYDLHGRQLARIYRGLMRRGENKYQFDPKQYNLMPGIYIFAIQAGGSMESRKFTVF